MFVYVCVYVCVSSFYVLHCSPQDGGIKLWIQIDQADFTDWMPFLPSRFKTTFAKTKIRLKSTNQIKGRVEHYITAYHLNIFFYKLW